MLRRLVLLAGLLAPACGPRAPESHGWLVLDAAAPALVLLDHGLLPEARVVLRTGATVSRLAGPGPWVLRAGAGGAWHRDRVLADGTLEAGTSLRDVLDLVVVRADTWWLERTDGGNRLCRLSSTGRVETWLEGTTLSTLAWSGDEGLAGGSGGELVRLASDGAVRGTGRVAGSVVALAGARAGWTVLAGPPGPRLVFLDRHLTVVREVPLPEPASGLVVGPSGGVWTWGPSRARAWDGRGRPRGVFETEVGAAVRRAVALEDGGVLLALPGALVELAPDARPRRTQGGFGDVVDLCSFPRAPPAARGASSGSAGT